MAQDAQLTDSTTSPGLVSTTCGSNGTCTLNEVELVTDWIKLFIERNSSASVRYLTQEDYDRIAHASTQMYDSIIGTNDPDLSAFRDKGGKIVGFHGTV